MVKSAVRVLEILEAVGSRKEGLTQKDLGLILKIPKSSLSNLLTDLIQREYLAIDRTSRRYVLGSQVLILAGRFLDNQDVVGHGRRLAAGLARETGESVAVAIPAGWQALIVYKEDGTQAVLPSIRVGTLLPLYASALGKAILAHFPEKEIRRYLEEVRLDPFTSATVIDPKELVADLKAVAQGALALNRGYYRDGISALAAPVFDYSGRVAASLAISLPSDRLDPLTERDLGEKISRVAEQYSRLMGYSAK